VHKLVAPGSEELRCMTVRSDKPEVLTGASNGNILRFSLPIASSQVQPIEDLIADEAQIEEVSSVEEEEGEVAESSEGDHSPRSDDGGDEEQSQQDVNTEEKEVAVREKQEELIRAKPRTKESIGLQIVKLAVPTCNRAKAFKGGKM
jgi:hypothetical protein